MPSVTTQYPDTNIGPFVEGEIPEPITVDYVDNDGVIIDLTGFTAEFRYTLRVDGVDSTIIRTGATIPAPLTGRAEYQWVDADMDTEGEYIGQMWVGDGTQRFASPLVRWIVKDSAVSPSAL